jgi:dTDP-4-amino-4,6-dideoxygalactose transaminase
MAWKIPLLKIYWDEDDVDAINKVIQSGTNWAIGPNVEKFEEEIANYLERNIALHLIQEHPQSMQSSLPWNYLWR